MAIDCEFYNTCDSFFKLSTDMVLTTASAIAGCEASNAESSKIVTRGMARGAYRQRCDRNRRNWPACRNSEFFPMKSTTTKQVAEIGDIAVTISTAQNDLRRVQEYLENRLGGRQDVQSIAHQLLEGLAVTQRRLGVARVQCFLLSATEDAVREARVAAEQYGLLH